MAQRLNPQSGPILAVIATLFMPLPAGSAEQDSDSIRDLVPTVLELKATIQDMRSDVHDISEAARETIERSGDIKLRETKENFVLSLASDILFAFDSFELSAEARDALNDVAKIVSTSSAGQITVLGHTDSKGTDSYNMELSQRRARSVADFLTAQGISKTRLVVEGRGETDPIADNSRNGRDFPEGRAQNRRVEFVVPKSLLRN